MTDRSLGWGAEGEKGAELFFVSSLCSLSAGAPLDDLLPLCLPVWSAPSDVWHLPPWGLRLHLPDRSDLRCVNFSALSSPRGTHRAGEGSRDAIPRLCKVHLSLHWGAVASCRLGEGPGDVVGMWPRSPKRGPQLLCGCSAERARGALTACRGPQLQGLYPN